MGPRLRPGARRRGRVPESRMPRHGLLLRILRRPSAAPRTGRRGGRGGRICGGAERTPPLANERAPSRKHHDGYVTPSPALVFHTPLGTHLRPAAPLPVRLMRNWSSAPPRQRTSSRSRFSPQRVFVLRPVAARASRPRILTLRDARPPRTITRVQAGPTGPIRPSTIPPPTRQRAPPSLPPIPGSRQSPSPPPPITVRSSRREEDSVRMAD